MASAIAAWAGAVSVAVGVFATVCGAVLGATYGNVGLAATFHPFVGAMKQRGSGRLVGVASVAGIRGLPGHGAYCARTPAINGPIAKPRKFAPIAI